MIPDAVSQQSENKDVLVSDGNGSAGDSQKKSGKKSNKSTASLKNEKGSKKSDKKAAAKSAVSKTDRDNASTGKKTTAKKKGAKQSTKGKSVRFSSKTKANDKKKLEEETKQLSVEAKLFKIVDQIWLKVTQPFKKFRKSLSKRLIAFSDAVSEWYHTSVDTIVEFFQSTIWRAIYRALKIFFITVSTIIIICFVILASLNWYYQDKLLPNIYVAGIPVSNYSINEARDLVNQKVRTFQEESFVFAFEDRDYKLTFDDLLIETEFDKSFNNAFQWGHTASHLTNQQHLLSSFYTRRDVPIVFDYDMGIMEQQLEMFVEEISTPPKNAEIVLNDAGVFEVIPSQMSVTTDFTVAYDAIVQQLATLEPAKIKLPKVTAYPAIDDLKAEKMAEKAQNLAKKSITLVYDAHQKSLVPYTISIGEDLTWIVFEQGDDELEAILDDDRLKQVIESDIAPQINQEHHNAIITLPEDGSIYAELDGTPMDGFVLREDDTIARIQDALYDEAFEESLVELAVDYEKGYILDLDGNDVGLTDLLGVGKSNFDGSSAARVFNIEKGLGLYNNMIIEQGQTFDFNEVLGPVTFANGWKAELAIFSGGYDTRPVAGGGLCQVSTTMYRAAVKSGLDVVERRPHSYLVSYYVKDSDPMTGIDATIYPGSQNLRFVNDTPGIILIQTYTDGNDAYIKFYGTSDTREVVLDGPYKSGWFGAGAPVLQPTTDLPPGEIKITHNAHSGRTITWYQTIKYPDGEEKNITINSTYRAIPAQGLIGAN